MFAHMNTGTMLSTGVIMLIIMLAIPVYPAVALSFEAGLIVGLFLHSSHSRHKADAGMIDSDPE